MEGEAYQLVAATFRNQMYHLSVSTPHFGHLSRFFHTAVPAPHGTVRHRIRGDAWRRNAPDPVCERTFTQRSTIHSCIGVITYVGLQCLLVYTVPQHIIIIIIIIILY